MKSNYYSYFSYGFRGFADSILYQQRLKIYEKFIDNFSVDEDDTILDVGFGVDDHPAANILEKRYLHKRNITAIMNEECLMLEEVYPEISFVTGDGKQLPFHDGEFDYVYSHAVIEHVGNFASQVEFLSELNRVAKKGVFLTTPNRLHLFEFHTGIPFIHLFPPEFYRRVYKIFGKNFYAEEKNLNLLRKSDLINIANSSIGNRCDWLILTTKFIFHVSNLILLVRKNSQ